MKKTLTDLWNGDICPCDGSSQQDEEDLKLLNLIIKYREQVSEHLDEEGNEKLEQLISCIEDSWSKSCNNAFIQGFSLATRLMIESLT